MDEREVDLRDYIKLIFRRKWLILGLFLLGVIMAGILTFYLTANNSIKSIIYEGMVWLEIGKIDPSNLIESPEQLIEKIRSGIYGGVLLEVKTTAVNPKGTNLIQIKTEAINQKRVEDILETVSSVIIAGHQEKIKTKKEILENKIGLFRNKVNLAENDKKDLEEKIKISSGTSLLILENNLSGKKQEINNLYLIVNSLEDNLNDIQATKIIKSAVVLEKSSIQKLILNITIGGLSGLFLGIFLVYLIEWWQAPQRRLDFSK